MSFSLSSLLNPEPSQHPPLPPSSPPRRRESLPPIQYVQSPQQHHAPLHHVEQQQQQQQQQEGYTYPVATARDAAQALATLSSSNASPPSEWEGQSDEPGEHPRSADRRPGSGHGAPIELPPPPPGARKMSSPTLEQYHVASRSPEQRRPSMRSPAPPAFTLPPLHNLSTSPPPPPPPPPSQPQHHPSPAVHSPKVAAGATTETLRDPDESRDSPLTALHSERVAHESDRVAAHERKVSDIPHYSPPAPLKTSASTVSHHIAPTALPPSSPAPIEHDPMATPQASSPTHARRMSGVVLPSDLDSSTLKAVASLKNEHGLRTHSPLRDSSLPVPSTETPSSEPASIPKKRPAPTRKKGTATTTTTTSSSSTRKAHPAKKRKVEPKQRSVTPSSRASKPSAMWRTGSSKGTPANSSPAPPSSNRSRSGEPDNDNDNNEEPDMDDEDDGDMDADADNGDVYCICRKPDNGTFMIGCDGTCDDWFHGRCVGIEERDKNLIDKYICPNCLKVGVGRTTWKRMCRRPGCRLPARVAKGGGNKGGHGSSKYCSEECGVLFFREMVAHSQGREEAGMKSRSSHSRRKSVVVPDQNGDDVDMGIGARGGVLAASEVKTLVHTSKTAEEFRKLGEGVLVSPPATPPDGHPHTAGKESHSKDEYYTEEQARALAAIAAQKEDARRRHGVLKDRMEFVTMVKQAASRVAVEKEVKTKEYCGYDARLEWGEEQFVMWRASKQGQKAFEEDALRSGGDGGDDETDGVVVGEGEEVEEKEEEPSLCSRKKCPRHLDWSKLAVDDLRMEMSENSDRMRGLDKEEREIRERAALFRRRKTADENGDQRDGKVEVHYGLVIEVERRG